MTMLDPDTLREIQRLIDEGRGSMCDPRANERRIARLLGIDPAALRAGADEMETGAKPQNGAGDSQPPLP